MTVRSGTPEGLVPNGERYLPQFKGTIELEHFHRYHLAGLLAEGRDVLDIASGEGYGSAILAMSAKSVVGVDIDRKAVAYAANRYRDSNISFRVGGATAIPLANDSVDMVVSFETIEHLTDHDAMISELRRVLRPGGLLMISSPSKLEYSDKPGYDNPFHERELYTEEFIDLVGGAFTNHAHYGQRLSAASLIARPGCDAPFVLMTSDAVRPGVTEARYDLILASDGSLPDLPHSAFEISDSDLQPYAAEAYRLSSAELLDEVTMRSDASEARAEDAEARAQEARRLLENAEARAEDAEARAQEAAERLRQAVGMAVDVISNKWWRRTRMLRRWSNSVRKRRGRPAKRWPHTDEIRQLLSGTRTAHLSSEAGWPTYSPVEGVPAPFGRSQDGPDVPVVPYSTVEEGFVEYREHPPLADPVVRAIAFYLPQFHPFPENDAWWGVGFTEWTNVGTARPLWPGHYQPHCPIHLGYYDLRLPEVMREQAAMARNYGISGFAYYFYWFAGKLLMETPLERMLADPEVDIPFCMIWANENWTRRWDGLDHEVLIAQDHSIEDSRAMLRYLQPFIQDPRYIRVDGRPLFIVYRSALIPDFAATVTMWRDEARKMGLGDLFVVSASTPGVEQEGSSSLDAVMEFPPHGADISDVSDQMDGVVPGFAGRTYDYDALVSRRVVAARAPASGARRVLRTAMLSWDNTARRGLSASAFVDFSVTRYAQWLAANAEAAAKDPSASDGERLVFVNAWNEWAEGAHLEPDSRNGFGYLEATRTVMQNYDRRAEPFLRPNIPTRTENACAVIAHVHYADTWSEIQAGIATLGPVDVYVTTTSLEAALAIAEAMPQAVIEMVDNRGRDVRPFLLTMRRIAHLGYRAICKVHGKKSLYRADGESLRRGLIDSLLDRRIMDEFREDDRLGMIAVRNSMTSFGEVNLKNNRHLMHQIGRQIGLSIPEDGAFVAGTMFWVAPEAIEPLMDLDPNAFDIERGLADGTRAHAIERLFAVVVSERGWRISTV